MRRWFLSYHSPDQTLAERLKAGRRLAEIERPARGITSRWPWNDAAIEDEQALATEILQ